MTTYPFSAALMPDVVFKVSVLLLIVWIGAIFNRKLSAATQHRWWTLGFVACLLIPATVLLTPMWTLPLLPRTMQQRSSTAVDNVASRSDFDAAAPLLAEIPSRDSRTRGPLRRDSPAMGEQNSAAGMQHAAGSDDDTNVLATASSNTSVPIKTDSTWTTLLIMLWVTGIVVCWSRSVWQHVLLNRILSRCIRFDDAEWSELLTTCSSKLGLTRNVTLLQHESIHSPMSARVWHPVVVLPKDAVNWNPDRKRIVLLHELAHVLRRDVITQIAAGLVCGLYWFNPLCWYGLFQMRKLREIACDDLVLRSGQQPAGYAAVLLDIARSYRHEDYLGAVGMARSSNVEKRITAILDQSRRHVSLSQTAARLLFAFAAALVCLVGTAQLRTQAEPSTATQMGKEAALLQASESTKKQGLSPKGVLEQIDHEELTTSVSDGILAMKVRILNEQGKPLVGAKLYTNVSQPKAIWDKVVNTEFVADKAGNITLPIDRRNATARLWAWAPGLVPEFANLDRAPDQQDALLPRDYEFRLAQGTVIGGSVVDEDGKPVADVHIRVKVQAGGAYFAERPSVNSKPRVSTWLTDSFSQSKVRTDAEGRWRIENAPGSADGVDYKFSILIDHPEYSSDPRWGELQRVQGVTNEQLQAEDATIVLARGTHIKGSVVDIDGKPITNGWVVWNDMPIFSPGVWEAELDDLGRFETAQLTQGEHPITIVAPGYAAQRQVVRVGSEPIDLRFELLPGHRIEIRFVDTAGNSVPKARVALANTSSANTWRNSNALHNHKHSNVPDYGVPFWANENGVYVWDWAPKEPVKYHLGAIGFASKDVSLVAKTEPHIVTLGDARVVECLVTDATTGADIKEFQAVPVVVLRPNLFSTQYGHAKQGANGRCSLPLSGGDSQVRYRVRFEAEGYRSVVSEASYGPMDGRAQLGIKLEPAASRNGRVVDKNGEHVADAIVLEGSSTSVPLTRNGEPVLPGRIAISDIEGRFVMKATEELVRIRVMHSSGVAEKLVKAEDVSIGVLQLRPWASISGRLLQDAQPIGDQLISYHALFHRGMRDPRIESYNHAITSPDGQFTFEHLPPGTGSLRATLGPWQDSPPTSSVSLPVELKTGENREIVLGGTGAVLNGQVVATGRDDVPLDRNYSLNYLISRSRGIGPPYPADFPALSFDPTGEMELSWCLDPLFDAWVATREHHFVKLSPNGDLRVTGVAPGEYDLLIRLYEQPAGCLVEAVGERIVPVMVRGNGNLDLGQIEVPCRAGPRVGSDMRAFEFIDSTGRKLMVNDMAGQYVLMHVWASWCAPCLESMLDTTQTLVDKPVTFVGLNIDQDTAAASKLAAQKGWTWSQNYLGEKSKSLRQLGISSVPTYFLIGPDGLLAASSNEWNSIKESLHSQLHSTPD